MSQMPPHQFPPQQQQPPQQGYGAPPAQYPQHQQQGYPQHPHQQGGPPPQQYPPQGQQWQGQPAPQGQQYGGAQYGQPAVGFQQPQQNRGPLPGYAQPPVAGPQFFSGITGARMSGNHIYIKPGRYWLRIDRCKTGKNNKQEDIMAIEMTVVHVIDNLAGSGHRVGDQVCRVVRRGSWFFMAEINGFIAGLMGMNPDEITPEYAAKVFDPNTQPLAWTIAEVIAWDITSRSNKPVTKLNWAREVPAAEAMATLRPEVVAQFFPDNFLQKVASAEAQQAQNRGLPQGQAPYPGQPQQALPPQQPPPGQYPPQQYPPQGQQPPPQQYAPQGAPQYPPQQPPPQQWQGPQGGPPQGGFR